MENPLTVMTGSRLRVDLKRRRRNATIGRLSARNAIRTYDAIVTMDVYVELKRVGEGRNGDDCFRPRRSDFMDNLQKAVSRTQ